MALASLCLLGRQTGTAGGLCSAWGLYRSVEAHRYEGVCCSIGTPLTHTGLLVCSAGHRRNCEDGYVFKACIRDCDGS